MLAEDNLVNQKLAMRLLEKRGHQVTLAQNGRQAVVAMEGKSFDLVLMDVQMPEMDGLEATRELRRREEGTSDAHQTVVAMTALAMKGDKERCMDAGMDGYLTKPIRPQELDAVLDQYSAKLAALEPEPEAKHPRPKSEVYRHSRPDGAHRWRHEFPRGTRGEIFRSEYPVQMRLAREALALSDSFAVRRIGHSLKGALANLSATAAATMAAQVEVMGKDGDLSTNSRPRLTLWTPNCARWISTP